MPKPAIEPLDKAELPDDLREMYETGVERTGDATIIGVMGKQPEMLRWYFNEFYANIFYNGHPGTRVDVRTKELLRIKLSKQHGCQFCNRSNTIDAAKVGITDEMLDKIFDINDPIWDGKDRAVLKLAEEMMLQNMDGQLSPALYKELNQYYDDGQIIEIGFIAAVLTGVAKWIFTYDIVDREETCPIGKPATAA